MKMKGSLAFGPTIKAAITVWKPSFLSFDVRAKAGLELSGECSIDMAETMDNGIDDTYDDVWSNIKLTTGLKIGLDLVGTAKKKEFKFLGASTTLFKQEKYLFPKFTTPALPQYQNGAWEASVTYFRCKQVQIGYTIPQGRLRIGTLRLSVSAQNLFTITKYSGFDPETAATGSVTSSGVDGIAYPNTRIFLFGVNLNF